MSPQHKSALMFAQASDLFRQGQTDKAREVRAKAAAIQDSLQTRLCHWCGREAKTVLIDDSPRHVDYACHDCTEAYAYLYDDVEPIE